MGARPFGAVSTFRCFSFFLLVSLFLLNAGSLFSVLTAFPPLFSSLTIPGLMVGILSTVMVQSSSTSTSIVVGLVGSGVMPVRQAIFVIMGANIGTSVTNTIVSLGHASDPAEYERAFAGATVHDMFNFLNVIVLLPIEWIVGGITGSGGPLYWLSYSMTSGLKELAGGKFKSPISVIIKPVYQALIKVDKDKIKALAVGIPTNSSCLTDSSGKGLFVAKVNYHICGNATLLEQSLETWDERIVNGVLTKDGAFKGMPDALSGALGLTISLIVLCVALLCLVITLKKLFLGRAKQCIAKAVNMNGYLAILMGAGMTIAVQSSSIITSALTPLVGIGTLPLEKMLPLTLGANIGTTCTALLASMVISTDAAIQIALCHLFFNIIGIALFYPIPYLRQLPIRAAMWMGHMTVALRWFPIAYICTAFGLIPLLLLGLSTLASSGGALGVFGIVLIVVLGLVACGVVFWYHKKGGKERIATYLEEKREFNRARMASEMNNTKPVEAVEMKNTSHTDDAMREKHTEDYLRTLKHNGAHNMV
jgi:sodium-dependent phosphate cotransporter